MAEIDVLQVNKLYYPWIGGVEKVVQNIAEGLKEEVNMEVLVCDSGGRGKVEEVNGVTVTRATSFGIYLGMPLSATFPFLLARKSRKADLLHFHLPFPLGVASYLLPGIVPRGKKVVVTYHSDIVKQEKLLRIYRPLLHKFLARADRILPTSPNLLESSPHLEPYRDKSKVVPLSIEEGNFPREVEKDYDFGFDTEEKIVLFVGRLAYYKGLNYLVEAMNDVGGRLVIAGEGEIREELEKKINQLGLEEKIDLLGRVSDDELAYLYQACDIFVLPSVKPSEAFGIVQMEAMAYGKPVVNTNLPTGVPYVSKDGETGITVPPRDPEALATAINELLENDDLRENYSRNAKKRVREKFSRRKTLDSILSVYRNTVN